MTSRKLASLESYQYATSSVIDNVAEPSLHSAISALINGGGTTAEKMREDLAAVVHSLSGVSSGHYNSITYIKPKSTAPQALDNVREFVTVLFRQTLLDYRVAVAAWIARHANEPEWADFDSIPIARANKVKGDLKKRLNPYASLFETVNDLEIQHKNQLRPSQKLI